MPMKLEELIELAYRRWKSRSGQTKEAHPDPETMACFWEAKLSPEEEAQVKSHLIRCNRCIEALVSQLYLQEMPEKEIPPQVLKNVENLIGLKGAADILEICLRLKDNFWELVNTTGDILVGQELVPAPVLRSRKIKDFKDEITILKDFPEVRVEIKVENKISHFFNLAVVAREKQSSRIIKDLRITLFKDDLELESYLAESGKVIFEHISLGKYTVELSNLNARLAAVILEIKA